MSFYTNLATICNSFILGRQPRKCQQCLNLPITCLNPMWSRMLKLIKLLCRQKTFKKSGFEIKISWESGFLALQLSAFQEHGNFAQMNTEDPRTGSAYNPPSSWCCLNPGALLPFRLVGVWWWWMVADSAMSKHDLQGSGSQIASSESRSVCPRHLDMGGMSYIHRCFL